MCMLLVPQTAAAAWRALFSVLGLPFLSFRPEPFSAVSIIVYIVAVFLFVCYVVSCTSSGRTRCFLFFTYCSSLCFLCFFLFFYRSTNAMPECVCRACRIPYDVLALQWSLWLLHCNERWISHQTFRSMLRFVDDTLIPYLGKLRVGIIAVMITIKR